ncbi:hypothetical protein [Frankia sp. AgW1.1]|uniref:hypothetical protein n=1 Tax=Frankia sp. AgW1.1 TaxID=1836971 RepID=UPI0019346311|nr:hypothetical protein [Frankia sp. AgW1.1]MBL7492521.1 hypothetical protein [Frankia sp. AgW1.1]
MATTILVAQVITIAGHDFSVYASKGELSAEAEDKDVTTHGSGGWKEHAGGLKDGEVALEFFQDFANLDAVMWPLLGTVQTFTMRANSGAISATNPQYSGSLFIKQWNPLSGSGPAGSSRVCVIHTLGARINCL